MGDFRRPTALLPLPIFLELLLDEFGQRLVHLLRFPAVGADHLHPRLTVEPQAVVVAAAVVSDEEEGLPPDRESIAGPGIGLTLDPARLDDCLRVEVKRV